MSDFIRKFLQILFLVLLFVGVVYVTNKPLFKSPKSPITEKTMDLPLSRCTVDFKASVLRRAVNASSWAALDGRTLRAKGDVGYFNQKVNPNNLAAELEKEYGDKDKFKWNPEKGELTLPKEGKFLTVPTWILYEFIDSFESDNE